MSELGCHSCGGPVTGPHAELVWTRCPRCRTLVFVRRAGPAVIVAHESDLIAQLIGVVLVDTGFWPVCAADGSGVMAALVKHPVRALVLDVALGGTSAFRIIEQLRLDAVRSKLPVILVASVFNRTAYKRRPKSLYGAADYVEQHHIPDLLPQKLSSLLNLPLPTHAVDDPAVQRRIREGEARTDLAGDERVRALARSIVADIALYHQAELEARQRAGEDGVLGSALAEGRRLLREIAGDQGGQLGDPIGDAFAELLAGVGSGPS